MELEIGSQVVDPVVEGQEENEFEGIEGKMNAMLKVKEVMFRKAKNNVLSAQERYKKDYNKKRKLERVRFLFLLQLLSIFTIFIIQEYEIGSSVLLRNSRHDSRKGDKMVPKWLGPYEIVDLKDKLAPL